MPPLLAHEEHIAERRQKPVRHRIFGKKAEPRGNPDRNPPSLAARLTRPDERVECCRPARQQHGVGRDQKGRKRDAGQSDVRQCGPEGGAAVIEPRRNPIDEGGGDRMQQRRRQADRKFAVPECPRRQRDDPGDQRRLRIIAERRVQGPKPVLRLVRVEVGGCRAEPDESRDGQHRDRGRRPYSV